jgi:hypothetical protein
MPFGHHPLYGNVPAAVGDLRRRLYTAQLKTTIPLNLQIEKDLS